MEKYRHTVNYFPEFYARLCEIAQEERQAEPTGREAEITGISIRRIKSLKN